MTWALNNGGGVAVENITEENEEESTYRLVTTYGVLGDQYEVLNIAFCARDDGLPAFLRALNEASLFCLNTLEVPQTPFDDLPYIQQAQALSLESNSTHLN